MLGVHNYSAHRREPCHFTVSISAVSSSPSSTGPAATPRELPLMDRSQRQAERPVMAGKAAEAIEAIEAIEADEAINAAEAAEAAEAANAVEAARAYEEAVMPRPGAALAHVLAAADGAVGSVGGGAAGGAARSAARGAGRGTASKASGATGFAMRGGAERWGGSGGAVSAADLRVELQLQGRECEMLQEEARRRSAPHHPLRTALHRSPPVAPLCIARHPLHRTAPHRTLCRRVALRRTRSAPRTRALRRSMPRWRPCSAGDAAAFSRWPCSAGCAGRVARRASARRMRGRCCVQSCAGRSGAASRPWGRRQRRSEARRSCSSRRHLCTPLHTPAHPCSPLHTHLHTLHTAAHLRTLFA